MAKRMTDMEIIASVRKMRDTASETWQSSLSRERLEVLRYYRCELPRPFSKGSSKFVSGDVYESVDNGRSHLVEAFSANNRPVKFAPIGPNDREECNRATAYCSHVLYNQNDGEQVIYDVISDGLMYRMGVVEVSYYEEDGEEREFEAITPDELQLILEEAGAVELDPDNVALDEDTGLLSGTFRLPPKRKLVLSVVPPERVAVTADATDLHSALGVFITDYKTREDLIKDGVSKKVVDDLPTTDAGASDGYDYEASLRGEAGLYGRSPLDVGGAAFIEITRAYVYLDVDGTGVAELYKVRMAGLDTLLDYEKIGRRPLEEFVPLRTPHTLWGENYARMVIPIQNARTTLIRGVLDHAVITNNPRLLVANGAIRDPAELYEGRLGGIVNVRRTDAVVPMPQSPLNPFVYETIKLLDNDKEQTTSLSKLSQGLNKDAISKQNSQALVQDLIAASQQRFKIVARRFGLFMKRLYLLIYDTARANIPEADILSITGIPITVSPQAWETRTVATLEVALSAAERSEEAGHWLELDQYLVAHPRLGPHYTPQHAYEVLRRALAARGVPDVQSVVADPQQHQPPPNPLEAAQIAEIQARAALYQAQAQAAMMKLQVQASLGQQKQDLAVAAADHKAAIDEIEVELAMAMPPENQKGVVALNGNV